MEVVDVLQDVQQLTGVKKSVLAKIATAYNFAIVDNVIEKNLNDEKSIKLDVGIGNLILSISNEELSYFFEPSRDLENSLISAIIDRKNPLEEQLINNINKHIYKTYKDMLEWMI